LVAFAYALHTIGVADVRWLQGLTVVAVAVVAQAVWGILRWRASFQAGLRGINAAMVGLLRAALYDPTWNSAIKSHADFGLALMAFELLMFCRVPLGSSC
jgi:chromate transporter